MPTRRQEVLAVLLLAIAALTAVVLAEVIATVFFAVTVAYVMVPARDVMVDRGLSREVASGIVTGTAFVAVTSVIAAFGMALFVRRQSVFDLIDTIPTEIVIPVGPFEYTVLTGTLIDTAEGVLTGIAGEVAGAAPVIALKVVVFAFVVFALLVRPSAISEAFFDVVPPSYHDVVAAIEERVRATLYGIYVLQAATAVGTFLVALAVFLLLGYDSAFTLAVIAGLLQFVPVLGPSVLIAVLAGFDLLTGDPTRAALILVVGGVFIAIAPDMIIRPRLARWAADLPTSLYFIGFVGGVLTVGAVGFVAGPLVVAVLIELVSLLSDASDDSRPLVDDAPTDANGMTDVNGTTDTDA